MNSFLSTEPYKGVRDFYPAEMAVQQYIFDTWSETARRFGYERYDASILEPSELYKSKGAENEEMVNEQTYTFIDRGEREVTLRPEMTPTVARMIAGKRRELSFPIRWYSIPNLFRYERAQRGRLREHWQLNCDIFGVNDYTADVEIILLANEIFTALGADPSMYEIRLNDREEMREKYRALGITDENTQDHLTRVNDRFYKISKEEYLEAVTAITGDTAQSEAIYRLVSGEDAADTNPVLEGLRALGVTNAKIDRSIARGFNYYTGTVFEIFDTHPDNNRSMLGGGRYDNLTALFGGDPIPGVGFGMGDVTMKNFLETHKLSNPTKTSFMVAILPMDEEYNLTAQIIAKQFRAQRITTVVDMSNGKISKKIATAAKNDFTYVLVVGEDEVNNNRYTLKNLLSGEETTDSLIPLIGHVFKNS